MASLDFSYRGTMRRVARSHGRLIVRAACVTGRPREVWVEYMLTAKPQRIRYRQLTKEF